MIEIEVSIPIVVLRARGISRIDLAVYGTYRDAEYSNVDDRIVLKISRIAKLVGATTEEVVKSVRRLISRGFLEIDGRFVRTLVPERLRGVSR